MKKPVKEEKKKTKYQISKYEREVVTIDPTHIKMVMRDS